jgi:hypothetical protein
LSFLRVWGCEAYVKKLQPDKLESKSKKCIFVGYPRETLGYTFHHPTKGKTFVAKTEKEFVAKCVGGRKVELDEIIDPSLEIPSCVTEAVPNAPSIEEEEEAPDENQGVLTKQTKRRSTRSRKSPECFGDPVLSVMMIDQDEFATYTKEMGGPESEKWLEAMKSEIRSMYDNQVWTLVDIPSDHKVVENKWIFKNNTDVDGNVTI